MVEVGVVGVLDVELREEGSAVWGCWRCHNGCWLDWCFVFGLVPDGGLIGTVHGHFLNLKQMLYLIVG